MKHLSTKKRDPRKVEDVKDCTLCPHLGNNYVASFGSDRARLFIIGSAPSANYLKYQNPFAGPAGELLGLLLESLDIEVEDIYYSPAVKCRTPNGRMCRPAELETCYNTWLKREIVKTRPTVLLLLGKEAYMTVFKKLEGFEHNITLTTACGRTAIVCREPEYFIKIGAVDQFMELTAPLLTALSGVDKPEN